MLWDICHEMGDRYSPKRVSFANFEVYNAAQKKVLDFLTSLDVKASVANCENLLLIGTVGTGKDHLLASLLHKATGEIGIGAKWINGQDWFGLIRDRMDDGLKESEMLANLSTPKILAISDPIPPTRSPSPWNQEMLYRLIDRRYRAMLPTWMTMNAASAEDADEKLSAPVFDRLRDGAHVLRCFWPSKRERNQKK